MLTLRVRLDLAPASLKRATGETLTSNEHLITSSDYYMCRSLRFDPNLDIYSVKSEGNLKVLDVNVHGTLNFSRIAAPFLRQGRQEGQDRSLVLLSSVNAFRESPGLYIYQASDFTNFPFLPLLTVHV